MVVGYHSNISLTPPTRASSHTVTQSVGHVVWGAPRHGAWVLSPFPDPVGWLRTMARGPTKPRGKRAGARFCVCSDCVSVWEWKLPRKVHDLTKTRPRGFRDASPSCPRRVLVGSWSCPFPVPSRTCPVQDNRTCPRPVPSGSSSTGIFDLCDGGLVHRGVEVVFDAPPQRGSSSLA